MSSARLAEGLDANPSVVRKLLVLLAQHGLVVSTLGRPAASLRVAAPRDVLHSGLTPALRADRPRESI
ncbi:hypothetical protein ACMHYB_07205 [Sorangium sp. So ce1128]